VDRANRFLDEKPNCEKFIDELLNAVFIFDHDALSIRSFLEQFAKSGTFYFEQHENEAWGEASMTDYGVPGWGFRIVAAKRLTETGRMVMFLGELIHAVGNRNGVSHTSDKQLVLVLSRLGVTVSIPEFDGIWIDTAFETGDDFMIQQVTVSNTSGPPYVAFGASRLFHSALRYRCLGGDKPIGVK